MSATGRYCEPPPPPLRESERASGIPDHPDKPDNGQTSERRTLRRATIRPPPRRPRRAPGAEELPRRFDVVLEVPIAPERRDLRPQAGVRRLRALPGAQLAAELATLGGAQPLEREDRLHVRGDVRALPRGGNAHRDVVLLVRARRDRVDGRGVREDLVLARERRCGDLRDHHPRAEARLGRKERRQARESGFTSCSVRRSLTFASVASAIAR